MKAVWDLSASPAFTGCRSNRPTQRKPFLIGRRAPQFGFVVLRNLPVTFDIRFIFSYHLLACPSGTKLQDVVTTSPISVLASVSVEPWKVPTKGLSVFYGLPEALRLFHYFLPRAILQGQSVLCLDGANRFDPLLIARFARERKLEPTEFGRKIRVARAFTCFQLTELLVRVPRLLQTFPAQVVVVTALPDLYFDEDVREREAISSFQRAMQALKATERLSVSVAVFTDATSSRSPRRMLFQHLTSHANHVLRFTAQENTGLGLTSEKSVPELLEAQP
jgi:hypothetical protein